MLLPEGLSAICDRLLKVEFSDMLKGKWMINGEKSNTEYDNNRLSSFGTER